MTPLVLMQAGEWGLRDLSTYSRFSPNNPNNVSIIDGHYYYDMSGDSQVAWELDRRLAISSRVMTIEGWIYKRKIASGFYFGSLSFNWARGFYMGFIDNNFIFSTGSEDRDFASFPNPIPSATAFHFAWVLDGSHKKLYVNGVLVGSQAMTVPISNGRNMMFSDVYPSSIEGSQAPVNDMVHQFVVWDGVKYTDSFIPSYVDYRQQIIRSANTAIKKITPINSNSVIQSQVLELGYPVARKVYLHDRNSGELVGVTWSDDKGNYSFGGLQAGREYYVLAIDHQKKYNAVVQDMLRAE